MQEKDNVNEDLGSSAQGDGHPGEAPSTPQGEPAETPIPQGDPAPSDEPPQG